VCAFVARKFSMVPVILPDRYCYLEIVDIDFVRSLFTDHHIMTQTLCCMLEYLSTVLLTILSTAVITSYMP